MTIIHKTDLFLIKLKNFSIRRGVYSHLILLLVVVLVSACTAASHRRPIDPRFETTSGSSSGSSFPGVVEVKKSPLAPWEVWHKVQYPNEALRQAYRFSEEGNLLKASETFFSAVSAARSAEEAEMALLETCSSLLKQGKSDEALTKISKYASLNKKKPGDLDARFSLLTAYAYINKSDTHQALAWFAQTYRASRGTGAVAEEARRAAMQYVRTFDGALLSTALKKWQQDTFVSSLIQGEESRRLQGGASLSPLGIQKWFDSETYSIEDSLPYAGEASSFDRRVAYLRDGSFSSQDMASSPGAETDTVSGVHTDVSAYDAAQKNISSSAAAPMSYGAYLPLSGAYQEHAKRIQEGINLSLEMFSPGSQLVSVDSETSGFQGIHSLVNANEVRALFGPLVVKDVEMVASLCERLRLPCVSFAKRKGIPDLSSAMFRLGANADNQVSVLIRYAERKLGAQSIVLFYPENANGKEFADACNDIRAQEGIRGLYSVAYNPRSLESVHLAVEDAKQYVPDIIIIADTLTSAEPLLRHLKDPGLSGGLSRVPLMGTSLFSDPQELRRYSPLVEGAHIVSLFNPMSARDEVQTFFRAYRKKFNREPDLLSALSYDATMFVLHAYNAEQFKNNLKGNEVRALFEAPDVMGVTGRIRVLDNGELYRDLPVLILSNGVLIEE